MWPETNHCRYVHAKQYSPFVAESQDAALQHQCLHKYPPPDYTNIFSLFYYQLPVTHTNTNLIGFMKFPMQKFMFLLTGIISQQSGR